jgi:hypothetical protein
MHTLPREGGSTCIPERMRFRRGLVDCVLCDDAAGALSPCFLMIFIWSVVLTLKKLTAVLVLNELGEHLPLSQYCDRVVAYI